jgi:hypothetical protein
MKDAQRGVLLAAEPPMNKLHVFGSVALAVPGSRKNKRRFV